MPYKSVVVRYSDALSDSTSLVSSSGAFSWALLTPFFFYAGIVSRLCYYMGQCLDSAGDCSSTARDGVKHYFRISRRRNVLSLLALTCQRVVQEIELARAPSPLAIGNTQGVRRRNTPDPGNVFAQKRPNSAPSQRPDAPADEGKGDHENERSATTAPAASTATPSVNRALLSSCVGTANQGYPVHGLMPSSSPLQRSPRNQDHGRSGPGSGAYFRPSSSSQTYHLAQGRAGGGGGGGGAGSRTPGELGQEGETHGSLGSLPTNRMSTGGSGAGNKVTKMQFL